MLAIFAFTIANSIEEYVEISTTWILEHTNFIEYLLSINEAYIFIINLLKTFPIKNFRIYKTWHIFVIFRKMIKSHNIVNKLLVVEIGQNFGIIPLISLTN